MKPEKKASLRQFAAKLDPKNQLPTDALRKLKGGDGGNTPPIILPPAGYIVDDPIINP